MSRGIHQHLRAAILVLAAQAVSLPAASQAAGTLYFVDLFKPTFQNGSLKRIRSDGTRLETIQSNTGGARALAIDPNRGLAYWSDVRSRSFSRLDLATRNERLLLKDTGPDRFFAFRMAIHPKSGQMFWGDQSLDQIRCANLDGTGARILIREAEYTRGFAIDGRDRLYWIAAGTSHWSIRRANLDGSNLEVLVEDNGRMSDLALDPPRNRMYFTDIRSDTIYVSTIDGQEIRPVFTHRPEEDVRSLAVDSSTGDLYWSEQILVHNRERIKTRRMATGVVRVVGPSEGFGNIGPLVFVSDDSPTLASKTRSDRLLQPSHQAVNGSTPTAPLVPDGAGFQIEIQRGRKTSIEFQTTPGARYQVQYSRDLQEWKNAGIPIRAQLARTRWIDLGPPQTESPPSLSPQRFYRVIEIE